MATTLENIFIKHETTFVAWGGVATTILGTALGIAALGVGLDGMRENAVDVPAVWSLATTGCALATTGCALGLTGLTTLVSYALYALK